MNEGDLVGMIILASFCSPFLLFALLFALLSYLLHLYDNLDLPPRMPVDIEATHVGSRQFQEDIL